MHKIRHQICSEPARWRVWFWIFCEVLSLSSFIYTLHTKVISDALICLLAGLGVLIPFVLEGCWHCRMSNAMFVFCAVYILASMAGSVYNLYDYIRLWDKLLHLSGGVLFAILGAYIPVWINPRYRDDRVLRLLFALLFSIAVSALWEFYEFSVDCLLGTDMQRDTFVSAIHSHLLSEAPGSVGSIPHIDSVIVNGQALDGYLDIGLFDTMGDMMIETAGAVIFAILFALDKGRHPAFIRVDSSHPDKQKTVHAQAR